MVGCVFTALFRKDNAQADRSVTISGSSIFYTSGEAEVWAHQEIESDDDPSNPKYPEYYSMFVFKDKKGTDAVNYRKHLAYSWKYNSADEKLEEGATEASLVEADGWFNMEIGFESYNFKKFVITFESQQYTQTKDGKTSNYVMFYPKDDGVQVVISGNSEDAPEETVATLKGHITIAFSQALDGDKKIPGAYKVTVTDKNGGSVDGKFENVGGTYARYSSSTTTPVTPLSFKAEFDEEEEENGYARMIMYRLNGQSFRIGVYSKIKRDDDGNIDGYADKYKTYYVLDGRDYVRNTDTEPVEGKDYYEYKPGVSTDGEGEEKHYRGGTINDNAPPVICFSNSVTHIGVGKELPFDYQLIDVLASSPSADTYYYMLTKTQAGTENFKADNYASESLFRQVADSDNQYMEPHKDHYIPDPEKDTIGVYDEENFKVVAAVKVYLKLYDTRTDNINQTAYVLLDWFVEDSKLVTINGNDYIAVANDKIGVTFAYTDTANKTSTPEVSTDTTETDKATAEKWKEIKAAYQKLVDEAAKDLKAGSKNYFYLPSFENIKLGDGSTGSLFADNITAYKDLSFNVYYNNGSNGNTSTQQSNTLSINLTKAGRYVFTIYATDKSSNPMYYYKGGEKKTFTASNIWSMRESKKDTDYEGTKDYLPWFTFNVESAEIEIEDPGEREAAFVGTRYSSISFDVNAVSINRTYELYRFDNDVYFNDYTEDGGKGVALTYEEFMEKKADLLEKHPEWFTEIPAASSLTKGSDEYEEFHDYGWNSSSPEFVPQDANTFYVVKLTVTSTVDNREPKTSYMGISCSAKIRSLEGEDTWLEDNMTSIILLAIAGASLVGIVLLLVIRPKNNGDIDEQFEAAKDKKKKSNK